MSDSAAEITVIIPAYDEADGIARVVGAVHHVLKSTGSRYEILVIDDGSTDSTAEEARAAGATVISHGNNKGAGAARRTGILAARGQIIVMLDGDGTYEPTSIPEMLRYFPQYDQVNGARTSEQGSMRRLRSPTKWFIRRLAIYLSGQQIPDMNTGLKAFKREEMLQYMWLLPDGFSCVTTMTLAFLMNGHPVKYVPTPYYRRIGQSKFHPVGDTIKYVFTVVKLCAFYRTLRVSGLLALVFVGISAFKFLYDAVSDEQALLAGSTVLLFCTGVAIGATGILLDVMISRRREMTSHANSRSL